MPTVLLLAIVACVFATLSSAPDKEKKTDIQKINNHRQRVNRID